jgi:hypothetical protein
MIKEIFNKSIRSLAIALVTSAICLMPYASTAQTIARNTLPSAGGILTGGSNQITFTIGQTVIPTLTAGSNMITQGFQQPGEQIRTGVLPDSVCAGDSLFIPMTAIDIAAGNTFTAQLSDAAGSFASPVTIGTATGQSLAVLVTFIPANTVPGNGYRVRVLASSPTVSSPASEVFTAQICIVSFNLKLFIEGYYIGAGLMTPVLSNSGISVDPTECDTILVELRDPLAPANIEASAQVILHTNGTAVVPFPNALYGNAYYVCVKSRNVIETWSKLPVTMTNTTLVDFTTP